MPSQPRRPYYSERHGRGPCAGQLSDDALRKVIFNVWDGFLSRDYFQEAFGYRCVDDGVVPGRVGSDPEAYFIRSIGRESMWPYRDASNIFDEPYTRDALFDMVEALFDLVSLPVHGRVHSFANCGTHYSVFDQAAGRAEYREEIDDVLKLCDPPYELSSSGEVIQATPDEFRPLMEAEVPSGTDHDAITARIESAKRAFVNRDAKDDDRRTAVVELAGVLEALRADVNATMLTSDESDLFKIANKFALRHNDPQQKRNYDHAVWHRWLFYVYLATIHAVLRVRSRGTS